MPSTCTFSLSKWAVDQIERLVHARVCVAGADRLASDVLPVFAAHAVSRLEALLLAHHLEKQTGRQVHLLVPLAFFRGRIGEFLRTQCAVFPEDAEPEADGMRSLLAGQQALLVLSACRNPLPPAPATVADAENPAAELIRTAAGLAAHIESMRRHADAAPAPSEAEPAEAAEASMGRVALVPVTVTHYPLRAEGRLMLQLAARYLRDGNARDLDEVPLAETPFDTDAELDIAIGRPLDVSAPDDDEVTRLTRDAFVEMVAGITVNMDHVLGALVRYRPFARVEDADLRRRAWLCAARLREQPLCPLHESVAQAGPILWDEPWKPYDQFIDRCTRSEVLRAGGVSGLCVEDSVRSGGPRRTGDPISAAVAAVETVPELSNLLARLAWLPSFEIARQTRRRLLAEDQARFEEAYARFYSPDLSKPPDVGRPFFLKPLRVKGGVILTHGYMAAPLEVRALADFLRIHGYAVYGVRMRGHGTAPEDLAHCTWADWYASLQTAYGVVRSVTDFVVFSGFSTGGLLALMGAARKPETTSAVVTICAPLQVRSASVRFVPSIVAMNNIMKRIGTTRMTLEYVENDPENPHINYSKNPVNGVRELVAIMDASRDVIEQVRAPLLVLQGSKDPVVNPISAQSIFDYAMSADKELTLLERDRHGIINGPGSHEVFERMYQFLERVRAQRTAPAGAATRQAGLVSAGV